MKAPKILIIDDDSDFAESMSLVLEMEGYEVDTAMSGQDGLVAAMNTEHRFILIDVSLPDINGAEILSQIKHHRPSATCFLLSGYSADHLLDLGIIEGATEILTKPIDVDSYCRN